MFKNFFENYISLNLKDYPALGFNFEINKFLIFLSLGLCIACVFISYTQSTIAIFIKKLIRTEAFSEENAKTLSELGLGESKILKKLIMKDSGAIKKAVSVLGIKKLTYEEYVEAEKAKKEAKKRGESGTSGSVSLVSIDFSSAKFYINKDNKSYAEHAFMINNTSKIRTCLYCVLIFAFTFALIMLMPSLVEALNSVFS